MRNPVRLFTFVVAIFCTGIAYPASAWEHWGGDRGGTRFSSLARIMSANVGDLARAWEYRTGDLAAHAPAVMARTKSETSLLLVIGHQNVTGGFGLREQVCSADEGRLS